MVNKNHVVFPWVIKIGVSELKVARVTQACLYWIQVRGHGSMWSHCANLVQVHAKHAAPHLIQMKILDSSQNTYMYLYLFLD